MGFRVDIYDDLTYAQIEQLIDKLQSMRGTDELACLALFVLSHGEEDGVLFARDKPYRLDKNLIQVRFA